MYVLITMSTTTYVFLNRRFTSAVPVVLSADYLRWTELEKAVPRWSKRSVVGGKTSGRKQQTWKSRRRSRRYASVPVHEPSRNGLPQRSGGRSAATDGAKGTVT